MKMSGTNNYPKIAMDVQGSLAVLSNEANKNNEQATVQSREIDSSFGQSLESGVDSLEISPRESKAARGSRLSRQIFVGGLPTNANKRMFRTWADMTFPGRVVNAVLVVDPVTHSRSRGFGFITFDSDEMVDFASSLRILQFADSNVEIKRAQNLTISRGKKDRQNQQTATHSKYVVRIQQLAGAEESDSPGSTTPRRVRQDTHSKEGRGAYKRANKTAKYSRKGSHHSALPDSGAVDGFIRDQNDALAPLSPQPDPPVQSWAQRLFSRPAAKPQTPPPFEDAVDRELLCGFARAAPPPATGEEADLRPLLFRRGATMGRSVSSSGADEAPTATSSLSPRRAEER